MSLSLDHARQAGNLEPKLKRFLTYGLLLSLGVHLSFFAFLTQTKPPVIPETSIEVQFLSALPSQPEQKTQRQIVSPPDNAPQQNPPKDTSRESDANFSTEKEQLKRGQGQDAGLPGAPSQSSQAQPAAQPRQQTAALQKPQPQKQEKQPAPDAQRPTKADKAPKQESATQEALSDEPAESNALLMRKLSGLRLDERTLQEKFSKPVETNDPLRQALAPASDASALLSGSKAFSRPPGSGAAFMGNRGSLDLIPSLPDGDITLLNAKADKFAVFVRRVATAVFSELRGSGWEFLRASDIVAMRDYATIRATLSSDGRLVGISLEHPSGSERFDSVLREAVKSGARDPHPPKEAALADGTIRFIFKARSWVRGDSSRRTGAPIERRWLVLATGLE